MDIREFSPHIFWSYDPSADVPQEVVIRQVIRYGEIKDIILLVRRVGKERIREVIGKWPPDKGLDKHLCFMQKVILA
jgi:hypothetical protein